MLVRELADLGDASILMFLDDIPPLSQLDTELCYVSWTVFLTTKATKDDIQDVFIFVNDDSKIDINTMLIRCLIPYGILVNFLSVVFILFLSKSTYINVSGILIDPINKPTIIARLSGARPNGSILI